MNDAVNISNSASQFDVARMSKLSSRIISVRELLSDKTLAIPQYQRPYKWTGRNINQLFSDIAIHKSKSSYRLGTIVLHAHKDRKDIHGNNIDTNDIVDGQQRTLSLLLAVRALIKRCKEKKLERKDLSEQLRELEGRMVDPFFESDISKFNIHNNYLEVSRIVGRSDFTEEHIDFLLNKCHVVTVALNEVSEAFQFFDSQNARGRDLEPHDLLKAYHLREFNASDESLKAKTVARWESSDTVELATLFSQYLYRIRNWSRGVSARYFSKNDVGLFKGINLETIASYPYVEQLRIAHYFVDHYNGQYERKIDSHHLDFPFSLDQMVINGRRFFELTSHYQERVGRIQNEFRQEQKSSVAVVMDGYAEAIFKTINTYPARNRTGDSYVRAIFDCLLIYYIDKFGYAEISRAIEKMFIWAFSLRLQMQVVQLASMDNYVLENNLFKQIKDATRPADFINLSLPVVTGSRSTKTEEIESLFRQMKYYE